MEQTKTARAAAPFEGIDVSKYQGSIDWPKVRAAGVRFAFLRAGYGSSAAQRDECFARNYEAARAAGMPLGAYWYSYATSEAEALQEAEACLAVLAGRRLEYPVWFDQEYERCILALTNSQRTAIVQAFCARIRQAGYRAGLYASANFLATKLDMPRLAGLDVWCAQYGAQCGWPGAAVWQYTSCGKVDGIEGSVDKNVCYKQYENEEETMEFTPVSDLRLVVAENSPHRCEIFSQPDVSQPVGTLPAGSSWPLTGRGEAAQLGGMQGRWYRLAHAGGDAYVLSLPDRCRVEPAAAVTVSGDGPLADLLRALAAFLGREGCR